MGIIGTLPQQRGIRHIGRCEGRDSVAFHMTKFGFGLPVRRTAHDTVRDVAAQPECSDQLLLGGGIDRFRTARQGEQMYRPSDSESPLKRQRYIVCRHTPLFTGKIRKIAGTERTAPRRPGHRPARSPSSSRPLLPFRRRHDRSPPGTAPEPSRGASDTRPKSTPSLHSVYPKARTPSGEGTTPPAANDNSKS